MEDNSQKDFIDKLTEEALAALTLLEANYYSKDEELIKTVKQTYTTEQLARGHMTLNTLFVNLMVATTQYAGENIDPKDVIQSIRMLLIKAETIE